MANEVDIVVKTIDQTGPGAKSVQASMGNVQKASRDMGAGFDAAGEKADKGERSILGLKDTVDGVGTIMQGPGAAGIGAYIQGWADLAGGMANFVIPAIKTMSLQMIRTAATAVTSAARQVGAWIVLSAQATASAARIAAAWLIAIGPVAIVIAAIVAVTVVIVRNWDKVKAFTRAAFGAVTRFIGGAIDWVRSNWPVLLAILTGPIGLAVLAISRHRDRILGFFRGIPDRIRGFFAGVTNAITAPFRAAVEGLRNFWNSTLGGRGFTFPGFDPPGPGSIPGFSFHIPRLAHGGIRGGLVEVNERGRELIRLPQGSTVIPAGTSAAMLAGAAGGGRTVIELRSDGSRLSDLLIEILRHAIRVRGGDVQVVLGRG